MKPARFAYFAPPTLADAIGLLAEHGERAKILAGGQSLVPLMNLRLVRPEVLVDLNRVTELAYVEPRGGVLRIGAMTRHDTVATSEAIIASAPLLSHAAGTDRLSIDPLSRHHGRQHGPRRLRIRTSMRCSHPGRRDRDDRIRR